MTDNSVDAATLSNHSLSEGGALVVVRDEAHMRNFAGRSEYEDGSDDEEDSFQQPIGRNSQDEQFQILVDSIVGRNSLEIPACGHASRQVLEDKRTEEASDGIIVAETKTGNREKDECTAPLQSLVSTLFSIFLLPFQCVWGCSATAPTSIAVSPNKHTADNGSFASPCECVSSVFSVSDFASYSVPVGSAVSLTETELTIAAEILRD